VGTNTTIPKPADVAEPLTDAERLYLFDAAAYGADHRNASGYARVGSFVDSAADMFGALAALTSQAVDA
jgi:hypothetical protein